MVQQIKTSSKIKRHSLDTSQEKVIEPPFLTASRAHVFAIESLSESKYLTTSSAESIRSGAAPWFVGGWWANMCLSRDVMHSFLFKLF